MTPVAIGGQRSVVVAAVVVSHKPITRSGGDVLLHQCDQVPWGIDVRFGVKLGRSGVLGLGLLYPREQTSSARPATSEKCH
jgi:hypothetical protein